MNLDQALSKFAEEQEAHRDRMIAQAERSRIVRLLLAAGETTAIHIIEEGTR